MAHTLKLLFSSFNNILQLISCFLADSHSKSNLWQVLIWVMTTWSTFLVGNYWVRSEHIWYPLTVSETGIFTTHSLGFSGSEMPWILLVLPDTGKICLLSTSSYYLCLFCHASVVQNTLALCTTTSFKAGCFGRVKPPWDQNSYGFWSWAQSRVLRQISSTEICVVSQR